MLTTIKLYGILVQAIGFELPPEKAENGLE